MVNTDRVKQIQKAMKLLGWLEVSDRISSPEDRVIFNKLREECIDRLKAKDDAILKKNKITF